MSKKDEEHKKVLSCGGVVWRRYEGRLQLLLVKQFSHQDRWGVPKGHIQKGETLEQCALREIKEETGVDVKLDKCRLPEVVVSYRDEVKTVVTWLAEVVGSQEPHHDDACSEVVDARWFDIDKLPTILMYQQPLITAALRALENV